MKFSFWPVGLYALVLLSFLSQCATAVERRYYIAAVNINWNYKTNGINSIGPIYRKAVYKEYDPDFKTAKTTPWSGLLGPTLRGQIGDTIVVTFRNMADHPCSIHPHGIAYGKQSEGSLYFDNTSQFEKEDDVILPGKEHTYYWEVTPEVAPQAEDPPCLTYTYFSHNDIVKDYNTGLIGTLLICKAGSLDEFGKQIHFQQEFTLLFGVFDESNTWYSKWDAPLKENVKYTINGFMNGSVPDLHVCAHSKVTWHFVGMSSEPELFSVHFNGQVLQQSGHKVSSIGIISGTATSAEMVAIYPGHWLLSSHISKHLEAGMYGFLHIDKCEEFTAPKRKLTIQQKRESKEWIYYIAAEEIIWNYAPQLPNNVDRNFQSTYLKKGAGRIGKNYKKAVFIQYKNESFKDKAESNQRRKELGILGPVIRAQIRDIIKIVFKNKASHPYSIYPHGLTIDKAAEGANYPEGGNQSHAVLPGETHTYVWRVIEEDEPLNSDSRCLTRMYHSAVNTPRDIASGLVGPLLICKSQSLNTRNVQLRADKEQHAMFAVFDENKSWYLNENINNYADPKSVKTDDPEFYESNVMHTINGYVYESGQMLGFCNGEIATWHVSSVGEQDDIQTATFYGHTFELNNREEDILNLFPMTGETITMNMANPGIWLMASLNTHETQKGLRVKFRDVECFRDVVMENDDSYEDEIPDKPERYSVWRPANETLLQKEKSTLTTIPNYDDPDSDAYAAFLGLKSLKNPSANDMEQLDLSTLDIIDNNSNNKTTAIRNETTTKTISNLSLEMAPTNSNGINTNTSNILLLQNTDSKNTSENNHNVSLVNGEIRPLLSTQISKSYKEDVTKAHTLEFLFLSTVDVVDHDEKSKDNIFTYSVRSHTSITDGEDVKDFVPLDKDERTETITNESLVEYSISSSKLPNSTLLEMQNSTTQSTWLNDPQELHHTKMNSNTLYEMSQKLKNPKDVTNITLTIIQELNSTKVDLDFSEENDKELNRTQVESKFSVDEDKELNNTQVNYEFSVWKDKELNSTQVESKFSVEEDKELNNTQVNYEFSVWQDKELNSTQVESNFSVDEDREINNTPMDSEFSVGKDRELNRIQVDYELSKWNDKELNSTHVESNFSVVKDKELNSTQAESIFSVEEDKLFNNTQVDSKFSGGGDKELNNTQVNYEFSVWKDKELNSIQVESHFSVGKYNEFNSTQDESIFSVEEDKEFNSTQVDYEFSVWKDELNSTQVESKFSVDKDREFNSTQGESTFPVEQDKELNGTQVDSEFSLWKDELNSTQVESKFSVDKYREFNSTQGESTFSVEEDEEFYGTQVDSVWKGEELNIIQMESNFSVGRHNEFNSKQVESTFSVEKDKELNSTQVDSNYTDFHEPNYTKLETKISNNTLYDSGTFFVNETTERRNLPQNVTFSSIAPFTAYANNETMSPKGNNLWTSSGEFSSEGLANISFSNGIFNHSSIENNSSQTNILLLNTSSEQDTPDIEQSINEVVIYLKDSNSTMAILTTPLDQQAKNWTYDGKHELLPMEFPDHMNKYITDKQPNSTKETKKKVYLQRVMAKKGYGMKTKKRKEYKPQLLQGLSPRSIGPPQLIPRTTKPNFNEEDMVPKAILIGIPRNDFNEYEIYVPHDEQDFDFENIPDNNEEYEYVEYKDPYGKPPQTVTLLDEITKNSVLMAGSKSRVYFITAEEINWDYAGYGQRREDKASVKERPTLFKKVLFRSYLDSSFTTPDSRGEVDEHLGIMGPIIKAEVDETIYIVFRNLASRPYSLHANGVSYSKNMEGLNYEDDSPNGYRDDNAVQPNTTFTYIWTVNDKVGPLNDESDCRIWTYYSGINPERDIHSGLIGPLLICRKGTLAKTPVDMQEFVLLFMTFDENKSWYYEENWKILKKTNRKATMDPNFNYNIQFHAINGIIYSLKGLRMYSNQLVKWHLINMGSPKDFHSIHFHGQTFIYKTNEPHRQGVYPLLPGGFATLEMWPSKPGLWMLESEVGISQQRGMQTLFLVLDDECSHPLGMNSGAIKDSQITASDSRDYWLPSLARLNIKGKYNAWSTTKPDQWIQVDFQRPVVISKIATQGAKQHFKSHFVLNYTIFYSTDRKRWSWYKGDSKTSRKTFEGNEQANDMKENIFFPPIISRYVRLYPSHSYNYPTVRMEFFGCELDGCSVPLGMQSGQISDHQITASSVSSNWFSGMWQPWFARLDKQGSLNAWKAKSNDIQPWIQVELKDVKKITGIVTQGAKTLQTEMFVTAYVLEYSDDGTKWNKYSDNEDYEVKTFMGNSDTNSHVKNYIYPPIFSRFIKIIPTKWQNAATMRIELLGCDF